MNAPRAPRTAALAAHAVPTLLTLLPALAAHAVLAALAALASPAALGAQGWVALGAAGPPRPAVRQVTERFGSELAIEQGKLLRRRDGAARALEPTAATGALHALVPSPLGTTFVVAERGLFATHPEVATLDPVDFAAGLGAGSLVGAVCDRADRLWLATTEALVVVHPGLWFHRAHGAADGLPEPPFLALEPGADGTLSLHTARGVFGYRPDPAVPVLERADVAALGPGPRLELALAGNADALDYRYRHASHHMLRPATGALDLRRPGPHALLVYAVDRDLDLSAPRSLAVHAPPAPGGFDARHAAALAAVLGAAFAVWRWRSARAAGRPAWRAALDTVLVAAVALQLGMAMTGVGRTFPFIGFTMYGEVYREHDVLYTPELVARTRDGAHAAPAGLLSFATDGVWRHLTSLLYAEREQQRAFVAGCGADVTEVELRIRRCRLTADGPRDVAPFVLARLARPEGR